MKRRINFGVSKTGTSPTYPRHADIERYLAETRSRCAKTMVAIFDAAFQGIAGRLRADRSPLARWDRQRRTCSALRQCSDRVLADIGIERDNIPLVTKRIGANAAPPWRESRIGGGECASVSASGDVPNRDGCGYTAGSWPTATGISTI